ncbi:serine/threonine protein kinase [Psychromonas aquimarina]|uniref:serine/threonine protein kinase n=1 Tax=Psychromonas aquimarina TaxID=444919 RepID=UPI0004090DB2|nr:serine/threonine protein kinase [Psychromonas aquimarina]
MTETNFSYSSLTPELQLDALASIGIYPESGLSALNSYENRVFSFTDENKSRYVVKFYRPQRWTEAQLHEEQKFSLELSTRGCDIAAPVIINGQSLFHFQDYSFALFHNLSARSMELDNIDILYEAGRALGKMHRIGAQSSFKHREHLDVQTMLTNPVKELQSSEYIPDFIKPELFGILQNIDQAVTQQLSEHDFAEIRLHGDCHAGNILIDNDLPFLVDFDDCKTGPAIQDLWMLINGDIQEKQLQLSMLLDGYQEEYQFNLQELSLIEPLRCMRMVNYVNWINKRWTDPAFPLNFPWFTTDQYWKELLQLLQHQLAALKEAPLSLQPGY